MTLVDLQGPLPRRHDATVRRRRPIRRRHAPMHASRRQPPARRRKIAPGRPSANRPPRNNACCPPAAAAAESGSPKFEAAHVVAGTARRQACRKAAFGVADGDKQALVTRDRFSRQCRPMIADPLENVNRWRGEVGLRRSTRIGLAKVTESIEIDGQDGHVRRRDSRRRQAGGIAGRPATLAAMVPQRRPHLVRQNDRQPRAGRRPTRAISRTFLKSVRFAADGGANDGN